MGVLDILAIPCFVHQRKRLRLATYFCKPDFQSLCDLAGQGVDIDSAAGCEPGAAVTIHYRALRCRLELRRDLKNTFLRYLSKTKTT